MPGFRKSTVDGYAVMAKNTQGVTDSIPVFLEVVGEVLMGQSPGIDIRDGQAVYVPTGGMLPDGADAVVMIEYVEKFDENSIAVYDSVSPGRNVILEGEDLADGDVFLKKGTVLTTAGNRTHAFGWDIRGAGVHAVEYLRDIYRR